MAGAQEARDDDHVDDDDNWGLSLFLLLNLLG